MDFHREPCHLAVREVQRQPGQSNSVSQPALAASQDWGFSYDVPDTVMRTLCMGHGISWLDICSSMAAWIARVNPTKLYTSTTGHLHSILRRERFTS